MDQTGPLSFEQEWLWLLDSATPGLTAYNVPRALRVRGSLDLAALERALTHVVERQAALRTTFRPGPRGAPVQVVAPAAPVRVAVEDLSEVPDAERADALRARLAEISRRKLDLARDSLLEATLLRTGPDDHVLSLLTHHIVSDGGSREVLFRELAVPRLVGTLNHQKVRESLIRELEARGFTVERHAFSGRPARALLGVPKQISGINLIAYRSQAEATLQGVKTWLVAHYDSKGQPISMALRLVGFCSLALGLVGLLLLPIVALALLLTGLVIASLNRVTNDSPGALDNATALVTVFHIDRSRGAAVAQTLLGPDWAGIVGSDRFAAYRWLAPTQRQVCWAHLKRDFQKLVDWGAGPRPVGVRLLAIHAEIFEQWHRFRAGEIACRGQLHPLADATAEQVNDQGHCSGEAEQQPGRAPGREPVANLAVHPA